jgi:hypothetical protein
MKDMGLIHDAEILARHYWEGRGMTHRSADTCACGVQTFPAPGREDARVRRARAFAEHQAKMLAASRGRR